MRKLPLALALAGLAALPFWVANDYYVNIAAQILLYSVFALALNVLVGYGGLVSLGHAGLFGIAAMPGRSSSMTVPVTSSRSSARSRSPSPAPRALPCWHCAAPGSAL